MNKHNDSSNPRGGGKSEPSPHEKKPVQPEPELPSDFPDELPRPPAPKSDRDKREGGGAEITPGTNEYPVSPPEFPDLGGRGR